MKFLATSILAVATVAIKLSDDPLDAICGNAPDLSGGVTAAGVFGFADFDESGEVDESELAGAIACAKHWGFLSDDEALATELDAAVAAGDDKKLSRQEAEGIMDDVIERITN